MFNKYNDLPKLAKWKALIIELGIGMASDDLFNSFVGIENFKTKYRKVSPTVVDFEFFDSAKDKYLVPAEIILINNDQKSLVKVNYRPNSPIVFDIQGGKVVLLEKATNNPILLDIALVNKRKYTKIKLPGSASFLEDFVQIVGLDRIGILAFEGCFHWNCKQACKFCDSNPKRLDEKRAMPTLNRLKDFDFDERRWWKNYRDEYLRGVEYAFKYILENETISPHRHLQLMAGNMSNIDMVWDICFEISQILNNIQPISDFDSYINLGAPSNYEYLRRAKKEFGFKQIQINLEVIGAERYKEVCPGKSSVSQYDNVMKLYDRAVEIFGFGNVRSNFVLGAQPVEELLIGINDLAKKGIVSDYSVFVPKCGTPWEDKKSLDMQTIVDFSQELIEIYKKYGFESIYCGMSSRSNILYELLNY